MAGLHQQLGVARLQMLIGKQKYGSGENARFLASDKWVEFVIGSIVLIREVFLRVLSSHSKKLQILFRYDDTTSSSLVRN